MYIITVRLTQHTLPRKYPIHVVCEYRDTCWLFQTDTPSHSLQQTDERLNYQCMCSAVIKACCYCSPLSQRYQGIFMSLTAVQVEWGAEQAKGALEGFCGYEKISKEDESVASLAAFFPSSGIHWGLATHFLLEPFPVRLGITRLSHFFLSLCTLNREAADCASEASKGSRPLHTHSLIL